MSEINKISNLDNINNAGTNTVKKSSESAGFSSFLGESKTLDSIFQEASRKYNVPVELLKAIGKAESNFNSKAVSRCGAQGVMQLMPATAKSLGVTDSFDAEQNIMGGSKYIAGLLKKYDGNTKLLLPHIMRKWKCGEV
jgi:soluble lytic murein transglycosylase-like protein